MLPAGLDIFGRPKGENRIARGLQPWAVLCSPVGRLELAQENVQTPGPPGQKPFAMVGEAAVTDLGGGGGNALASGGHAFGGFTGRGFRPGN